MVKHGTGVSGASEPQHCCGAGCGGPDPAPRAGKCLCVVHRYHNCFSLVLAAISLTCLVRLVETIFFFYRCAFWGLFLHFALAENFTLDIISISTAQVPCDVAYIQN